MLETVFLEQNRRLRILTIFGTRPEAIKMAPVVKALNEDKRFEHFLAITAQHREMLDQVLSLFNIQANFDLNIMEDRQTLSQITIHALKGLDGVIENVSPDLVLVHGDTTTTFVGALSAYYHGVPVAHVEAGLRTHDRFNPYPEEMNRILTDCLADIYFAPTPEAKKNLQSEGKEKEKIYVTGNTVVDALESIESLLDQVPLPSPLTGTRPFVLVEIHRRENWGEPLRQIALAIKDFAQEFPQLDVAFSLHRNPIVRENVVPILEGISNIHLFEPFNYLEFLSLMKRSLFILSDSGGIQEEAPSFHRPVLVTRQVTERPEGVLAGVLEVVGVERERVRGACRRLVLDREHYLRMSHAPNPFGDGQAAWRIREYLLYYFGFQKTLPPPFRAKIPQRKNKKYGASGNELLLN